MKRIMMIAVAALLTLNATLAFAQDPNKVVVDKSMLTAEQLAKVQTNNTIQQVQEISQYAGLGKEIGEGVNGALSAITDNANKFADTKVGTYTMWLVAYKVVGNKIVRLALALLFWVVLTAIFIWAWGTNARTRRILVKQAGPERQWQTVTPHTDVQLTYGLIYLGVTLILLATGGC